MIPIDQDVGIAFHCGNLLKRSKHLSLRGTQITWHSGKDIEKDEWKALRQLMGLMINW